MDFATAGDYRYSWAGLREGLSDLSSNNPGFAISLVCPITHIKFAGFVPNECNGDELEFEPSQDAFLTKAIRWKPSMQTNDLSTALIGLA